MSVTLQNQLDISSNKQKSNVLTQFCDIFTYRPKLFSWVCIFSADSFVFSYELPHCHALNINFSNQLEIPSKISFNILKISDLFEVAIEKIKLILSLNGINQSKRNFDHCYCVDCSAVVRNRNNACINNCRIVNVECHRSATEHRK